MSYQLKTALFTAALAVLSMSPRMAMAQDAKIALVDIQTLVRMSDEGKAASEKIEKRFQTLSGEMEKFRKEIEDKESSLRTQERMLSATARSQRVKEIDDEKIKFDRKNQDYQKDIAELENSLLSPVFDKAREELNLFVNEKGVTILIDLSVEKANVVWANAKNDITQDVMKRMNEKYKKSASAAPAPAAAKPATPAPAGNAPAAAPAPPKK